MTEAIEPKIIVGLDVGSSKVAAVVGEILPDGVINVMGWGTAPSRGVDRGSVIDLEAVSRSIQSALEQAESISECQILGVTLAISGQHITALNESGAVPVTTVTEQDIEQAMNYAQSVRLPDGLDILHILPQEYKVDGVITKKPISLSGKRLIAHAHLIAVDQNLLKNLVNAVEHAKPKVKLKVDDVVFSGLASSHSVLTEDEKEAGVCLIDIGGGTMEISVYTEGSLRFSRVIPYAGNSVTDYLAQRFATSRSEAENIKINYGSAISPPKNNAEKKLEIAGLAGSAPRIFTKAQVSMITSQCYEDLLRVVDNQLYQLRQELLKEGIKNELIAGFVLTGGGSQIEDIVECAKNVFNSHVRIGSPLNITGLTDVVNKPQYATVLGLLHYNHLLGSQRKSRSQTGGSGPDVFENIKKFFTKGYHLVKSNF